MKNHSVSLIIAVYNKEKYLRRCLDSALAQTLEDIEILVVDDASTDHSVEVIEEYCRKNSKIRLLRNRENRGAGYAKNLGIRESRGTYIAFLDADDSIPPEYLERMYVPLKHSDLGIAVSDLLLRYSKSETKIRLSDGNLFLESTGLSIPTSNEPTIISAETVAGSSVGTSACTKLVKRELWERFPFYEGYRCDDLPAVFPMLAAEQRVLYIRNNYYEYLQITDSVERAKTPEKTIEGLNAVKLALIKMREHNVNTGYSNLLVSTSMMSLLTELLTYDSQEEIQESFKDFYLSFQKAGFSSFLNKKNNVFLHTLSRSRMSFENRMTECLLPILLEDGVDAFFLQASKWKDEEQKVLPLVSIVIPVYNGANYLRDAIDTSLAQTYPNIEVIVINDGSTDNGETERIALSYGDRIRYYSKENGGVSTALNLGIQKMRGAYFSWLSHDDMYKPEKVEKEMEIILKGGKEDTIVACGYDVVDANGEYLYNVNLTSIYPRERLGNPMFVLLRGGIHGCTLLIHKSHFDRVGLFDASLPSTQDYDLWFRMLQDCSLVYSEGNYVLSRSHEEQNSRKMENHMRDCNNLWIWMMENTSSAKRKNVSGTEARFFEEMYDFLRKNTNYDDAVRYAKENAEKMYRKEVDNLSRSNSWRFTSPFRRIKSVFVGSAEVNPEAAEEIRAKQELLAIKNSYSWRLTEPLRVPKQIIKFVNKNGIKKTAKKIQSKLRG